MENPKNMAPGNDVANRQLRKFSGVSIERAAVQIGVSYTWLWKAEYGYCKLKPEQTAALEKFYREQITERLERVGMGTPDQK